MKLIINQSLLSKLSFINLQINSVEWMGVLIYKTKGSFPNNFIMEAVDVLLMSRGEPAEVGIDMINSHHGKNLIGDLCEMGYEEYSRCIIHL